MKQLKIAVGVLFLSALAFGQSGVRFGDGQPVTTTVTVPGVSTQIVIQVPNAGINFC